MTRFKLRNRFIFPSFIALSILVSTILASNYFLESNTELPAVAKQITENSEIAIFSETENDFDTKKADEYANYAEKLNDLVADRKMSAKVRDNLLENYEDNWL